MRNAPSPTTKAPSNRRKKCFRPEYGQLEVEKDPAQLLNTASTPRLRVRAASPKSLWLGYNLPKYPGKRGQASHSLADAREPRVLVLWILGVSAIAAWKPRCPSKRVSSIASSIPIKPRAPCRRRSRHFATDSPSRRTARIVPTATLRQSP